LHARLGRHRVAHILTFRFEAADLGGLRELIRRFCDTLEEVGDELWARYEAAVGSHT